MSVRTATSKWNGTLKDGKGTMNFSNYSGPFTYVSRFEEGEGTNPEELVGAAHSGCFSMFLAALISGEGLSPESVETTASVHLGRDDTGPVIVQDCRNDSRPRCGTHCHRLRCISRTGRPHIKKPAGHHSDQPAYLCPTQTGRAGCLQRPLTRLPDPAC